MTRFKALSTLATLAAPLFATLLASSDAEAAAPALRAVGPLKSAVGDYCIDAGGSGFNVHMWECHGLAHQTFYLGVDGHVRAESNPNRCLAALAAVRAAPLAMMPCADVSYQKWRLTEEGQLQLRQDDNYCLDIAIRTLDALENGSQLHLWGCHGGENQKWETNELPWAQVRSAVAPDRCLDVAGGSGASSTNVITWYCHDDFNQQFMLTPGGELRSAVAANRCLDVSYGNFSNWSNVQSYECNDSDAQKWVYTPAGELRSAAAPDYCLDVAHGNTGPNANVQLYRCNGSDAQRWSSPNLLNVRLMVVEGMLAVVYTSADEGYAVTNPAAILQLLHRFGYDALALEEARGRMSQTQLALLDAELASHPGGITEIAEATMAVAQLVERVEFSGPGTEDVAGAAFVAGHLVAEARAGIDLVTAQAGEVQAVLDGPEAAAVMTLGPQGFGFTAGATAIGATAQVGSQDGTYGAFGVSAGAGLSGAVRLGQNGQYGASLGIGVVTVSFYVHGDDLVSAADDVAGFANDANDWADGALSDTEEWLNVASGDAEEWAGNAVTDVGDALYDAAEWFVSLF